MNNLLNYKVRIDKRIYTITGILLFLSLLVILPSIQWNRKGFSLFAIWSEVIFDFKDSIINIKSYPTIFLINICEFIFIISVQILFAFILAIIPAALISTIKDIKSAKSGESHKMH